MAFRRCPWAESDSWPPDLAPCSRDSRSRLWFPYSHRPHSRGPKAPTDRRGENKVTWSIELQASWTNTQWSREARLSRAIPVPPPPHPMLSTTHNQNRNWSWCYGGWWVGEAQYPSTLLPLLPWWGSDGGLLQYTSTSNHARIDGGGTRLWPSRVQEIQLACEAWLKNRSQVTVQLQQETSKYCVN